MARFFFRSRTRDRINKMEELMAELNQDVLAAIDETRTAVIDAIVRETEEVTAAVQKQADAGVDGKAIAAAIRERFADIPTKVNAIFEQSVEGGEQDPEQPTIV